MIRRRATGAGRRPLWRQLLALLVVAAVVLGTGLIGSPAYAVFPFSCPEDQAAPAPEFPTAGTLASIDGPVKEDGGRKGDPESAYLDHRYAGTTWNFYNQGCFPTGAPGTWAGNFLLGGAKGLVAVTNWAHYLLAGGSGLLDPLDDVVTNGVQATWAAVFVPWIGLALMVVACMVLLWAGRGDLPRQTRQLAYTMAGLAAAGATLAGPTSWTGMADEWLIDAAAQLQDGFLPGRGPDSLPTVLYERVIFDNWVRGEFPALDENSRDAGRVLLSAQAYTVDELSSDDAALAEINRMKACAYGATIIATASSTKDASMDSFDECDPAPESGQNETNVTEFSGGIPGARVGGGLIAFVQALVLCLFQLAAKFSILVSLMVIRIVVICMPIIAVVGIVHNAYFTTVVKVVGTAIFNAILIAGLAGLHAMVVITLFDTVDLGLMLGLATALIFSGVLWSVARPIRRMTELVRTTGVRALGVPDPVNELQYANNRTVRSLGTAAASRAGRATRASATGARAGASLLLTALRGGR